MRDYEYETDRKDNSPSKLTLSQVKHCTELRILPSKMSEITLWYSTLFLAPVTATELEHLSLSSFSQRMYTTQLNQLLPPNRVEQCAVKIPYREIHAFSRFEV